MINNLQPQLIIVSVHSLRFSPIFYQPRTTKKQQQFLLDIDISYEIKNCFLLANDNYFSLCKDGLNYTISIKNYY